MDNKASRTVVHRHRIEKSFVSTLGDVLNLLAIGATVYFTYRKLFTPFVQAARVDWSCYSAEVIVSGKEYYLKSIDDEVPLQFGYVLKFVADEWDGQDYIKLIVEKGDREFEVIQKNKVR